MSMRGPFSWPTLALQRFAVMATRAPAAEPWSKSAQRITSPTHFPDAILYHARITQWEPLFPQDAIAAQATAALLWPA